MGGLQSLRTFLSDSVYKEDIQAGYDSVDSLFPSPPQSLLQPLLLDSRYYLLNESYLQSHPHLIHSHPHLIHNENKLSKNLSLKSIAGLFTLLPSGEGSTL